MQKDYQGYLTKAEKAVVPYKNQAICRFCKKNFRARTTEELSTRLETHLVARHGQSWLLHKIANEIYYDENTLTAVCDALKSSGLNDVQCDDALNAMQNAGILFRERVKDDSGNKNVPDDVQNL